MASQPPPLKGMRESFKENPFKDSMSSQVSTEMLRQYNPPVISHPTLSRQCNTMSLDNNNLHGRYSQNISSMPSRFSTHISKKQCDAAIQSCSADSPTSNMMELSQQCLEDIERPHTISQSSKNTVRKMIDLPQPLIDFNKVRTPTSFSGSQDEMIRESYKASLIFAPREIPQGSNNFEKAYISHLPSNMHLDSKAHMNQKASNETSYSINFDHQQNILRDNQKYYPVNSNGGYYGSVELNQELLNVNAAGKVTQQPMKHCCSDFASKSLKDFHKKQAAFTGEDFSSDLLSVEHMQINAQSTVAVNPDVGKQSVAGKVSVEKLTPLEMAIRNPLPCWNHPVSANGKLYQRIKSPTIFKYFNYFGFSDENLLVQMTKSLEQISTPIPFPKLAGAPKWLHDHCVLNGQVCQPLTHAPVTNLLPLVSWNLPHKARLPVVPINSYKFPGSDRQSTASIPQEMEMRSASFVKEQISSSSSALGSESHQYPRASLIASAPLSPEGQGMMNEAWQKAQILKFSLKGRDKSEGNDFDDSGVHTMNTPIIADHSTHASVARREMTGIFDRSTECTKERDRAGILPTQDSMVNAACDDFSVVVIFQEKLKALKSIDQKYQEQRAPLIQNKNIDLNGGDAMSLEASRLSERKWYLERKAYLETLRETRHNFQQKKPKEILKDRELDSRRNDATCLDRREFTDYGYLNYSELNEIREAKHEFQASIDYVYYTHHGAKMAKDAACMKLERAVADRKALWMENIHRLDDPRFEKESSDADKKLLECQIESNKRVGIFDAIEHACQQKYEDIEAFQKVIGFLIRASGDNFTRKTEPAKNDSVCTTFTGDHHSARVIIARLEAHYTGMGAKSKLQPLRTIDDAWTDGHYGFLEKPMYDKKQRNNSTSSNDYITAEEHAEGLRDDYGQSAFQAFTARRGRVPTHHDSRTLKTNTSSRSPKATSQYPNPGSRNYYSVKSTDHAEYTTMFKGWKPRPSHLDIMNAMTLGRAARERQLAHKQPGKMSFTTFQYLRKWGYLSSDTSLNTADSAALTSPALNLLDVKEQSQCAVELADKEVTVFNNANDTLTKTSKATDIPATVMNEQTVLPNDLVTDTIDVTKKLADIDVATTDKLVTIADKADVEAAKSDDITTLQQAVSDEIFPIGESTANAEMTIIEDPALNDLLISDTEKSEILSKDMMQKSLVLDFPSAPPPTPVRISSPRQEVDLEYDSDFQSDASWATAGDDDHDGVAEAGGLEELESVEEIEEVEEWEML
ncbi:uncharacterized protein EAE97_010392 [Botrytis byssoidea]|uniref:Uncharacterized protein n=1 Tax=Botrytis byssoidea TaxID=139641 RepID=A0A9P5I5L8_9HELO|nr:uncharacterized protein EAE97_010392 [Botrytis byssoidea]KAF7926092.1 hypothetical protein EAE97_010392 [Botrytis byssoidea]